MFTVVSLEYIGTVFSSNIIVTLFSIVSSIYVTIVSQALNRWGYYPLILIGSWAFGTINRIHDFIEPSHKIFWLSVLDVGTASLMVIGCYVVLM